VPILRSKDERSRSPNNTSMSRVRSDGLCGYLIFYQRLRRSATGRRQPHIMLALGADILFFVLPDHGDPRSTRIADALWRCDDCGNCLPPAKF